VRSRTIAVIAICGLLCLALPAAGCGGGGGGGDTGEGEDSFLLSLAGRVDVSRMMEVIQYLAGEGFQGRAAGTPETADLEDYLERRFREMGLKPAEPLGLTGYRQEFPVPADRCFLENPPSGGQAVTAANILGMIPGTSGDLVILTANYDGLGKDPQSGSFYPGADYNASGVSAVMEAAAVLSSLEETPGNGIVFALLGAEECGGFGASALAETLEERGLRSRVRVINLEGLGAGEGDYMDVWDLNYRKNRVTVQALEQAAAQLGVVLEIGGQDPGSSAGTFFLYHVPAVTCDWAWFRRTEHPDFHQTSDTPDRINREDLGKAARVVVAAAWELANTPLQ